MNGHKRATTRSREVVPKIRDCFRNHRALMLFGLLILVYISLLLWASCNLDLLHYSPDLSGQSAQWWETFSDKASVLNLYVDIGGFALAIVGGLLAAFEFQEARKAAERIPNLRIEEKTEGSSIRFEPNKNVTLMLKNEGKGIARHFLVELEVPTVILAPSYYDPGPYNTLPDLPQAFAASGGRKYWNYEVHSDRGLISCHYYNRGDFPCFDKDQIPLAEFQLDYRKKPSDIEGEGLCIRYSIKSEKMKKKDGEIRIVSCRD